MYFGIWRHPNTTFFSLNLKISFSIEKFFLLASCQRYRAMSVDHRIILQGDLTFRFMHLLQNRSSTKPLGDVDKHMLRHD
jgi:hypothetical protein